MIIDAHNQYSAAQALTATAVSTNIIDHSSDRNLGIGEPLTVLITVGVAADGGNSDETYTAVLQTDDNSGFSSATQIGPTVTITRGTVAGTKYVIPLPPDTSLERYTRLSYTLGGTTPSVTLTAVLVPQSSVQTDVVYPDGFDIT